MKLYFNPSSSNVNPNAGSSRPLPANEGINPSYASDVRSYTPTQTPDSVESEGRFRL